MAKDALPEESKLFPYYRIALPIVELLYNSTIFVKLLTGIFEYVLTQISNVLRYLSMH